MVGVGEPHEDGRDAVVGGFRPGEAIDVSDGEVHRHALALGEGLRLLDRTRGGVEGIDLEALPRQPDAVAPPAIGHARMRAALGRPPACLVQPGS